MSDARIARRPRRACPAATIRPPCRPAPGPEVDQPIGLPHDRFVVLDDEHRVAAVLQVAQGVDQPLVVARVQADRRFVEHVAHADQPGAEAGGQPHALQLAAAERVGRAVERQVVEADPVQETPAARADLRARAARAIGCDPRSANVSSCEEPPEPRPTVSA